MGFPGGAVVKKSSANAGYIRDPGSTPGSGRYPGEGNGNPFQYSCLENPVDRGDWWLHSMVLHRVVHDRTTDTSGDSSEICKIQMSFYCEQVDLEV